MIALFVIWQDAFVSWTFDREQGTISHRRLTPLGMRKKEYAIGDVIGAQVGRGNILSGGMKRAELVMREGRPLSITTSKAGSVEKERIATTIREFLQLQ